MRLDELADRFLEANRHTFRANTHRAYRADLLGFARSFPTLDTADLAPEHLCAFLAAADRAPATLARRRAALRSCCAWAYRNGFVAVDPASHLDKISLPQRDPRPLTTDQVEALLAAIPALSWLLPTSVSKNTNGYASHDSALSTTRTHPLIYEPRQRLGLRPFVSPMYVSLRVRRYATGYLLRFRLGD